SKACRLDPDCWLAFPHLAEAWALGGASDELWRRAGGDGGESHDPRALLALSAGLGLLPDGSRRAMELAHRAIQLHPDISRLHFHLGSLHLKRGEPKQALDALLEGWHHLPPDDAFLHSTPAALAVARAHLSLGAPEEGQRWLRVASDHAQAARPADFAASRVWEQAAKDQLFAAGGQKKITDLNPGASLR
ncbi:MAG: hypothetical protein AAFY88_22730, partial [Acidobacteriota bacterium]